MNAAELQALQALEREWQRRGDTALDELRERDPAAFVALVAATFPEDVRATLRELLAQGRRHLN